MQAALLNLFTIVLRLRAAVLVVMVGGIHPI